MTNVSKRKLKKEVSEKITKQFINVLSDLDRFNKTSSFAYEFFTKSERVMFAKRLAIIFLVLEDFPPSIIFETLAVSPSTVNKVMIKIDRGGYQSIKNYFGNKKKRKDILSQIEIILRAGLPPIAGKGRWARVNKILSKS